MVKIIHKRGDRCCQNIIPLIDEPVLFLGEPYANCAQLGELSKPSCTSIASSSSLLLHHPPPPLHMMTLKLQFIKSPSSSSAHDDSRVASSSSNSSTPSMVSPSSSAQFLSKINPSRNPDHRKMGIGKKQPHAPRCSRSPPP